MRTHRIAWLLAFAMLGLQPGQARAAALYVSLDSNNTVATVTQGSAQTFASGFSYPSGLAFDAAGDLYVASYSGAEIRKVDSSGHSTSFATLPIPYDLAFNDGYLYASHLGPTANANFDTISRISPAGVVTTFATGVVTPSGLAFDRQGNLYVANRDVNYITKITPSGTKSMFATGFNLPNGLDFDAVGNLYVADWGTDSIKKVTPNGTVTTFANTGLFHPLGLVFDTAGQLYVSNYDGGGISRIDPTGAVSPFAPGLGSPAFLAIIPEPAAVAMLPLLSVLALRRKRIRCCAWLAGVLLFLSGSGAPAQAATIRYELKPPPGQAFVSPSYSTPVTTDGKAVGWTSVTNISALDPVVWDSNGVPIDLAGGNPSGLTDAAAFAVAGGYVVGAASGSGSGGASHAIRWNLAGGSALDLHPVGYQNSNAYGISGNQIAGSANVAGGQVNAALWNAMTGTFVNLNPANRLRSVANATDGSGQIGYGDLANGTRGALLWQGSAASVIDLNTGNPIGMANSLGRNLGGGQQVGVGYGPSTGGNPHAVFWKGTAASMVDLHPTGFLYSDAYSTNGVQQAGFASNGNDRHAFLWSGSAASGVDLHLQLPPGFVSSDAWNIDTAGNVFGLATDTSGNYHFVEWAAVPEPSGAAFCAAVVALVLRRRRSSRRA